MNEFDCQRWKPCGAAARSCRFMFAAMAACLLVSGCAALTNPVANGVPVRILPDELLAPTREGYQPIPLTLLRQPPPEKYILAPGDILAVQGLYGDDETPPPVNIPDSPELPPSVGYPVPIRLDGTISLPYAEPIPVAGLSIEDAERKVTAALTEGEQVLNLERRVLVTLMRPRYIEVLVIRDDSQHRQLTLQTESLLGLGTTQTRIGGGHQGTGMVLQLPVYQNDVLNALTRSGGLPGLESTHEVVIQRGYWNPRSAPAGSGFDPARGSGEGALLQRIVRIPMRTMGGLPPGVLPEDIILENGDVLLVQARDPEFYYTGGLLPANEHPLPNDYDLTAIEAVLKSQGPLLNGGLNSSNLNGAVIQPGIGNPSPSLLTILRRAPNGGQVNIRVDLNEALRDPRENIVVQAGDVLMLQETPDEAITRYFTHVFQADLFVRWLNRSDAQGTASVLVP